MEVLGNTKALMLNNADSVYTLADAFNSTSPTSTTFSIGTNGRCNDSGQGYIAYCFATKQGFSSFGSYIGNGNSDGPFIYTGFKPAWIMTKKTSGSGDWLMRDIKRFGFNGKWGDLYANNSQAENTNDSNTESDILSNGFKLRMNHANHNEDGGTYIYWAFADSPFTSSAGAPTTAR
tara:strand:- start:61 stop:591 length:531 start_codon:yes stop_codon:yes gene_type:complete